jgi:hypothetical protein
MPLRRTFVATSLATAASANLTSSFAQTLWPAPLMQARVQHRLGMTLIVGNKPEGLIARMREAMIPVLGGSKALAEWVTRRLKFWGRVVRENGIEAGQ